MPRNSSLTKRGKVASGNVAKKANVVAAAPQRIQPSTKKNLTEDSSDEQDMESDKENEIAVNHPKRSRSDVLDTSDENQRSSTHRSSNIMEINTDISVISGQIAMSSTTSSRGSQKSSQQSLCRESITTGHLNLSAESNRRFVEQNNHLYMPASNMRAPSLGQSSSTLEFTTDNPDQSPTVTDNQSQPNLENLSRH